MAIHENYEDFIAGDSTKTNWPTLPASKKRVKRVSYFVDLDGITIGKGDTLGSARKLAKMMGGTVRRHVFTEENLQEESTRRRRRIQRGDFTIHT